MTGEMRGHHNEVLNHSPKSAAQCLPFHGRIFLPKGFLSNHAQDVAGHHSQFQSQRVSLELSGREAFEIHVAFQFAVEPLRFPMGVIEGDKGAVGKGEVCPNVIYLSLNPLNSRLQCRYNRPLNKLSCSGLSD